MYKAGMHNIIGTSLESADNVLKSNYRQWPDMKNYAVMPCR